MLETPFWIFCTGVIDSTGALPVYDVLEIKKKRASPVRNNPYPVKPHFLYDKHNTTDNDTCQSEYSKKAAYTYSRLSWIFGGKNWAAINDNMSYKKNL